MQKKEGEGDGEKEENGEEIIDKREKRRRKEGEKEENIEGAKRERKKKEKKKHEEKYIIRNKSQASFSHILSRRLPSI